MLISLLIISIVIAAYAARSGSAASLSQLHHREHHQRSTLWRDRGTVRFFARRPWLARTEAGRRALRFARCELRWTHRELTQTRALLAALRPPRLDPALVGAFACIHHYEGAWNADTGNGYHGGLQMDVVFEATYGPEFVARWGDAENWPVWAQLQAAIRAYQSGRGFSPWPNTRRSCGV